MKLNLGKKVSDVGKEFSRKFRHSFRKLAAGEKKEEKIGAQIFRGEREQRGTERERERGVRMEV